MMYNPSLPVAASWSLEFQPVNVSVVFMQRRGEEHFCIGSHSWPFEPLADCIANSRTRFPWEVDQHLLPPEEPPHVWEMAFSDKRIFGTEHVPTMADQARMFITQRLLALTHIDTAPRVWEPQGNNAVLIDSLNGYSVNELGSHPDTFTLSIVPTFEQYLVRAVEHYAVWVWANSDGDPQPLDWSERKRMRAYA